MTFLAGIRDTFMHLLWKYQDDALLILAIIGIILVVVF